MFQDLPLKESVIIPSQTLECVVKDPGDFFSSYICLGESKSHWEVAVFCRFLPGERDLTQGGDVLCILLAKNVDENQKREEVLKTGSPKDDKIIPEVFGLSINRPFFCSFYFPPRKDNLVS